MARAFTCGLLLMALVCTGAATSFNVEIDLVMEGQLSMAGTMYTLLAMRSLTPGLPSIKYVTNEDLPTVKWGNSHKLIYSATIDAPNVAAAIAAYYDLLKDVPKLNASILKKQPKNPRAVTVRTVDVKAVPA